jgi:hypothetical protein
MTQPPTDTSLRRQNGDGGPSSSTSSRRSDTQYVISVRGPHDKDDLLTDAEAFAESFAILE